MNNKAKMGFWTIVLFGINSIIGSGIFLLPNNAMSIIGPASLGVLLFDMLLVLAMTFCFAEASGLFKDNGGPYIYAKEAFGDFIGYEVGFLTWITRIIAFSTMGVGFATALGGIMPELATPMMKNVIVGRHYAGACHAYDEECYRYCNFCAAGGDESVRRAAVQGYPEPCYGGKDFAVCAVYRHGHFLY